MELMHRMVLVIVLILSPLAVHGHGLVQDDIDVVISRIAEQRSRFDYGKNPPFGHFLYLMTHGHRNIVLYPEGVSDRRYLLVVTYGGGWINVETGESEAPKVTASFARQDRIAGQTRHTWVVRFPFASPVTEVPFEGGALTKYFASLGIRIDRASLPREVLHTLDSVKGFAGYEFHRLWGGYEYFYIHGSGWATKASSETILGDDTKIPLMEQPYRLPDHEIEFIRRQFGKGSITERGAANDDGFGRWSPPFGRPVITPLPHLKSRWLGLLGNSDRPLGQRLTGPGVVVGLGPGYFALGTACRQLMRGP